ncbi:hypothetical protein ACQKGI_06945 [Peribacillus muralis]|uniref:hypothetical protein n=1 Tax=Peribacillus muralis TaxID=264697 RepID=UPI003814A539
MKKMITVLFIMMVLTACANATDKDNLEATKKRSYEKNRTPLSIYRRKRTLGGCIFL